VTIGPAWSTTPRLRRPRAGNHELLQSLSKARERTRPSCAIVSAPVCRGSTVIADAHIQARRSPPAGIEMVTHDPSGWRSGWLFARAGARSGNGSERLPAVIRPDADVKLRALTNRVCAEAHALAFFRRRRCSLRSSKLFERAPLSDVIHTDSRRRAFERFVSGCIKTYFDADATT